MLLAALSYLPAPSLLPMRVRVAALLMLLGLAITPARKCVPKSPAMCYKLCYNTKGQFGTRLSALYIQYIAFVPF